MSHEVIHCARCVSATTRPRQLYWGDQEMECDSSSMQPLSYHKYGTQLRLLSWSHKLHHYRRVGEVACTCSPRMTIGAHNIPGMSLNTFQVSIFLWSCVSVGLLTFPADHCNCMIARLCVYISLHGCVYSAEKCTVLKSVHLEDTWS